ncbi:MAG: 2,3-bisphosphoglycerate-independent phosphoglycerate mutase [bacterium]|nr:2,3-bisphosphoglycerate-independent phosphoglycerate mutase [bacterium]
MARTCVLLMLDGFGVGRKDVSNPIHVADGENLRYLRENYPSAALQASGIAVGLPWEESGNSKVGHLTIGAGRTVYQNYPRISLDIRSGKFFENEALLEAINHAKTNYSTLHLCGLLSEGHIHSSLEHLEALLSLAAKEGVKDVALHLIADGKDSAPKSVEDLLSRVESITRDKGVGRVASIIGRYYGMDKNGNWDRTAHAYSVMTADTTSEGEFSAVAAKTYERGMNDDFIPGFVFGPKPSPVKNNDALVFFNFQEDDIRQLAASFILPAFDKFERRQIQNLFIATFTKYSDLFEVPVAFPQEEILNTLGQVISDSGKAQMLVAETINYAATSYYFNGLRDEVFDGQFNVSVPSLNVPSFIGKEEMQAKEVANRVVQAVDEHSYDFIFANFANADILAQTGNFDATVKAVKAIDGELGRIIKTCEVAGVTLIVTSAHGNAENVMNSSTGAMDTRFNDSPVPIYFMDTERKKASPQAPVRESEIIGMLSDLAPTVLEIMDIEKPKEMTGKSLVGFLR